METTAADRARAECEAQGVPFKVTDRSIYKRLAQDIADAKNRQQPKHVAKRRGAA